MKHTSKILLLLPTMIFLSACSLTGGGNDGGIFRSDDGGKTFASKDKAENNRTISGVDILSLAVNPQNGNEIYAGSKASGIFKSTEPATKMLPVEVSVSLKKAMVAPTAKAATAATKDPLIISFFILR